MIDNIDLFIAGIAIENEMTLITNNENHFMRLTNISDLRIANWKTGKRFGVLPHLSQKSTGFWHLRSSHQKSKKEF